MCSFGRGTGTCLCGSRPVPGGRWADGYRPETDAQGRLVHLPAGSSEFMKWFQDRPGDVAHDEGSNRFGLRHGRRLQDPVHLVR